MNKNIQALVDSSQSTWTKSRNYYLPEEIGEVLALFLSDAPTIKTNKKIVYYNVPCAFDIETSSFYVSGEKQSVMYEWTLGLNGYIIIGRTWEQFMDVYKAIVDGLQTGANQRLRIYVHNLSFEFQYLMFRLQWDRIFAIEQRKPIEALTIDGIEFRCSYLLSGYSLDHLANQLQTYKTHKMVGDLDYSLIRHSETPLTTKEIEYCRHDVIVVMAYIQEKIEDNHNNISYLTLTKTGVVRNFCRKSCMMEKGDKYKRKWKKYQLLMQNLTVKPNEYRQLKKAFQGGFTHANPWFSEKCIYNVESYDFTSSYPAVMISEQFPMSRAEEVEITTNEEFQKNLDLYCCLFDVELFGIEATVLFEHPLSYSRCYKVEDYLLDNGRIVSASHLFCTVTEQDYFILEKFYTWKQIKIGNFKRYHRGYLPTDFVKAILKLYADKTELKNVADKEREYLSSKEMLNSCYGMAVTDIVRDEDTFNGEEWETIEANTEECIEAYNKSKRRFLFYPWGVWVTAYARKNLFTAIWELKNDYIYADTDSVKVRNGERHRKYFEEYNKNIERKLLKAMQYHVLPPDAIRPKTIKGKEKVLGVWDREDDIQVFKTLGAKRYLYLSDYKLHLTIAGVSKSEGEKYLVNTFGKYGAFKAFNDGLYFPPENSGKKTHTYIDEPMTGEITDYMGTIASYNEFSGIHLENAEYSLSLTQAYINYLFSIKEVEEA